MKLIVNLVLIFVIQSANAQVELIADGPGNTYELITSILAPGYNPIEVPDCNHEDFGEHIDEAFDTELNKFVFRFHIHTNPDNDRCINFDRQRNEIKSYDKSPENLLGREEEIVRYKWKFKLPSGFQSSPNFTHLHQLKSVGGPYSSLPMYSIITRKSTPDRLELRYSGTGNSETLSQTELQPFIDTWLEVTETIKYGSAGTYKIQIRRIDDNEILFDYENESINNWKPESLFVRPKWGIYRSLLNAQDLRDEIVLFADFSVEELQSTSTIFNFEDLKIYTINNSSKSITIDNQNGKYQFFQILTIDGKSILMTNLENHKNNEVDISSYKSGNYILNFVGEHGLDSRVVFFH